MVACIVDPMPQRILLRRTQTCVVSVFGMQDWFRWNDAIQLRVIRYECPSTRGAESRSPGSPRD